MRFTKKKIETVIISVLGEEGFALVDQLTGKENVSEFDLANKAKLDIKIIRKMLYMLYNHNLVGFTRKKDKQKGWYIYYWTLLPENIKFDYYKRRREQLEKLKRRLEEEHKELFFVCPNKCVRLNFDQGMDFEFHCPECGELITQDDNKDEIKIIKNHIDEIEDELKKLQESRIIRRKQIKKKIEKTKKKVIKKRVLEKKTIKKPTKKKPLKKKVVKRKSTLKKASKTEIVKKKILKKLLKKSSQKKKPIKKTVKKKVIKKKSKTKK
ncbi:MAG: hypothetical protein KJ597_06855 [Nanoarchaeota archaeon]|nr:hypothetical protein [Nanoarchaeota archaeon]MBU1623267.1 hypothetical protein [Nanoarchaeota archaeon]